MRSRNRKAMVAKIVVFASLGVAVFGKAVEFLWNWLMPAIFGLTAITFWQALGLLALSWLLFGGWRGMHGRGPRIRSHWKARMAAQWEQMTPEEREQFRDRCGPRPARG